MAEPLSTLANRVERRPRSRSAAIAPVRVPAWVVTTTLALALASIVISLVAALTRGPWIDEFWTLFAIDRHLSLSAAFQQRWLTDVHPPLFYFVSRLLAAALGDDVAILRLQNAIAMAGLLAFFLYAHMTWKNVERFLPLCAVLTFSSYFATGYFAEYRSYYAQFVSGICCYGCAYALLRGDVLAGARDRRITTVIFAVTAVLLVNLHFVTTLLMAVSFAGLAAVALLLGERRLAVLICAVGLLAAAPLVVTLVLQASSLLGKAGGRFWINTGLFGALSILVGSIAKGIGLNLMACVAAGRVLLGRSGADVSGGAAKDRVIGAALLGLATGSLGILLLLNLYTPIIIDRYLVLCSAAIICGLAIVAQAAVFSRRGGFAMVVANAVLFLGISGHKLVEEPRWNASAALIGAEVADCPSSVVEAFTFPHAGALPNEASVFALGYGYLAARYGFRVRMARPGAPIARDDAGKCPTLLWTEHVPWTTQPAPDGPDALVLDAARQALGPIDLGGAVVEQTKTGALVVLKSERRS
jgi:hypothetical protein